ncbi:hypothetical protein J3F83DRAFT_616236 [Trichoderma novae-zelandiae]
MSSTYLDNELRQVQTREKQAYMHLCHQLGLISPIPAQDTSATSLPPPVPPRNPARGTHYPYRPNDTETHDPSLRKAAAQEQQVHQRQQQVPYVDSLTAADGGGGQALEIRTKPKRAVDATSSHSSPSVKMSNLSDAINSALDEWADISTHQ